MSAAAMPAAPAAPAASALVDSPTLDDADGPVAASV
jgi:hypothetical protein